MTSEREAPFFSTKQLRKTDAQTHKQPAEHILEGYRLAPQCSPGPCVLVPTKPRKEKTKEIKQARGTPGRRRTQETQGNTTQSLRALRSLRSLARCARTRGKGKQGTTKNNREHQEGRRTQGSQRNTRLETPSQNVVKGPRQGIKRQRKTLPKYLSDTSPNGAKNLPKSTPRSPQMTPKW